jgi:1,4-dihydroxy-2-naphthoate octaprenyltransferase
VSGIIVGSVVAMSDGYFSWLTFLLAILTTLSLQILSNIANDVGDAEKGTDNENRLGPVRSLQAGHLTAKEYKKALFFFVIISAIFGLALIFSAFHSFLNISGIIMLIIGGLAILASIKYTVGKRNYGYHGLGDVFVFLFFGLASVLGSYFLMAFSLKWSLLLPAAAFGFLITAVINLNNMRDIENDKNCKKNTIPVRIGLANAEIYHYLLIILAWICLLVYSNIEYNKMIGLLYVLVLPFFVIHIQRVSRFEGKALDSQMKTLSISILALSLIFSLSQLL